MSSRTLIDLLKLDIKADTTWIRSEKPIVRHLQRTAALDARPRQSALDKRRVAARARLVLYGLARGRPWASVERNHPDGDPNLLLALMRVWNQARAAAEAVTASPVEPPAALHQYLSPWALGMR
jgi:hypothetical protein